MNIQNIAMKYSVTAHGKIWPIDASRMRTIKLCDRCDLLSKDFRNSDVRLKVTVVSWRDYLVRLPLQSPVTGRLLDAPCQGQRSSPSALQGYISFSTLYLNAVFYFALDW